MDKDFPALSLASFSSSSNSTPASQQPPISFSSITQQQQLLAQQQLQQQNKNPATSINDFPALGGQSNNNNTNNIKKNVGPTSPTETTTANPIITSGDKYGLFGLINVIRMTDQDTNMVALGLDIPSLGLSLNSIDPIHSKFMSPFTNDPFIGSEPIYTLPKAYSLDVSVDLLTRVSAFSEETLFYCFYGFGGKSSIQEASAQELFLRGWRFHMELKLWLCKENEDENKKMDNKGGERSVFIFFDPNSWVRVKKEWTLVYNQLEDRGFEISSDGTGIDVWKKNKPGSNNTVNSS